MASVENPVGPPIPEFPQATEERPKVAAAMTGQKARNVLEEDRGRSVLLHKVEEGEGEDAAFSSETGPPSGDAEVLTGKTAGPESCVTIFAAVPVWAVASGFDKCPVVRWL